MGLIVEGLKAKVPLRERAGLDQGRLTNDEMPGDGTRVAPFG
jgi:hypothetical protein